MATQLMEQTMSNSSSTSVEQSSSPVGKTVLALLLAAPASEHFSTLILGSTSP